MERLSDAELEAYAEHALLEHDAPLHALVVELQQARLVLAHVYATLPRVYARLERLEGSLVEVRRVLT